MLEHLTSRLQHIEARVGELTRQLGCFSHGTVEQLMARDNTLLEAVNCLKALGLIYIEWSREVFADTEDVTSETRWAGNIDRGGLLESIRVSCLHPHDGFTIQVLVQGDPLFAAPVAISAQTVAIPINDSVLIKTLLAGKKIDVVTVDGSGSSGVPAQGLQVGFLMKFTPPSIA